MTGGRARALFDIGICDPTALARADEDVLIQALTSALHKGMRAVAPVKLMPGTGKQERWAATPDSHVFSAGRDAVFVRCIYVEEAQYSMENRSVSLLFQIHHSPKDYRISWD